ncbi:thrombopoietin receptor isoform X2 [Engraulis encrasicolus]|uniref:thrombopoietin receptor isoform X2 n=1 Tax=Engraulis encrasicolus TaxID=184585 RepID=UPI002FD6EB65
MLICWILLLWMQSRSIFAQNTEIGLSTNELQLLASENEPTCFARTDSDFTCFWESVAGHSYKFFYRIDRDQHECNLTQQTTDNGTILHVCFFNPAHVYRFIPIELSVLDVHANETVLQREVYVDEKLLPYPMKNISIDRVAEPGQLQVRHKTNRGGQQLEIKYFSQTQPLRTETVKSSSSGPYTMKDLAPGEVCSVQMRVKSRKSFWSDWSKPTLVMIPQKAEATDLLCYTSDLWSINCQWNKRFEVKEGSQNHNFAILYRTKMGTDWGDWKNCTRGNGTQGCSFDGEQYRDNQVIIRDGSGPLDQIFYTEAFKMNNSIKTGPPMALRGEADGARLHLHWDAPSEVFAQHLIYEIRYRSRDQAAWKHFTWQSPEASLHLNEQTGSQYLVQIKAKPNGVLYDGYWSDWSDVLTADLPSNNGLLFFACIPLVILLLTAVITSVLTRYFRKIKQYLWPPVPKLDKILESFLTEGPQWDPTFNIKQCDDTPASVVEIVSDNHASTESIPAPSTPEMGLYSRLSQKEDAGGEGGYLEAGRDYVTLTTKVMIPCLSGNEYVYGDAPVGSAEMQCHCMTNQTRSSSLTELTSTSLLNQSYLLQLKDDQVPLGCDSGHGDRYTNLNESVTGTAQSLHISSTDM